jgi:hypothetical protein
MLRHPVLIAYDERRLQEELNQKRSRRELPTVVVAYTADGKHVLHIPLRAYNSLQPGASRLLDATLPRFTEPPSRDGRPLDDARRLRMFTELFESRLGNHPDSWRMLLHEWSLRRPQSWPQEPGEHKTVGIAFGHEALGIENERTLRGLDLVLRDRTAPTLTTSALMELAFDLEHEKVHDQIYIDTSKVVVLAVMSIVPFTKVPLLVAAICTAIAGFIEFMLFLEDAEADGEITEEEVGEAYWQALGILPFDLVQQLLMYRSLAMLAEALLTMLVDGINDLIESWNRRRAVVREGWGGYLEHDAQTAIFIPDYAI